MWQKLKQVLGFSARVKANDADNRSKARLIAKFKILKLKLFVAQAWLVCRR